MNMTRPLRILLADDNDMVRSYLRTLLEAQSGWQVIAEVWDGQNAVEKTGELKPDVVIMDVSMPGLNGLDATREILKDWPEARVLILTMHESDRLVDDVLQAGARGCLLKSKAVQDLASAVRATARVEPTASVDPTSFAEFRPIGDPERTK
jgi:DNA-binding NarL/FixJ family response regulator